MTVQKVKYKDKYVYISDEMNDKQKGYAIYNGKDNMEDTIEFKPFDEKDLYEDTIVDSKLFGESDEK